MHSKCLSVAILIDDKFPSGSGVARSVQTQIEELSRLGHKVTLIAPSSDFQVPTNAHVVPAASLHLPGMPLHAHVLYASRSTARRICMKHHFDVVHSQTDTGALLLAAKIAEMQSIPHLHTFHTNIAGSHTTFTSTFLASVGYRLCALNIARIHRRRLPIRPIRRTVAKKLNHERHIGRFDWRTQAIIAHAVDASSTPSHYMADYIRTAANGTILNSYVIPTGYSRAVLNYAQKTRRQRRQGDASARFITVGRLAKEKRLDTVIEAFRNAAIPESELIIVGDGAEYNRLLHLSNGVSNIKLTGHIDKRSEIVQLLRDSDVFVLASHHFDNQPIVVSESLVAGVPILYCDERLDVGLNCRNSLLVHPDTAGLAAGMRTIIEPKFHQMLVDGTNSVLAELSPEVTTAAYVRLYQRMIDGRLR